MTDQDRINQLEIERDEAKCATDFANLRITQLEASCAAMRSACVGMVAWWNTPERDQPEKLPIRIRDCEQAIRADAGKSLLDRLQAVERDNGLLKEQIRVADVAYQSLHERHQAVEKQAKEDKEYIEDLCAQLCKMEDALGFKNDCTDKEGAFVPTIGPWLERVRDLIAAEGELGDVKARLQAVEKQHTALRLASEELIACVRHGDQEDIGEAMAKVEAILQPKEQ